jgi:hypothetical protein
MEGTSSLSWEEGENFPPLITLTFPAQALDSAETMPLRDMHVDVKKLEFCFLPASEFQAES